MALNRELTDSAILQSLGERLARHRIEASLTQAELAERAGIGKRTLERVEAGQGAELVTLIKLLRALDIIDGLERLVPELPPSPIAQLELRGKQRQRVTKPRRDRRSPTPTKPWTWGEP